jgi:serine/threonine-protein kinase RsbW
MISLCGRGYQFRVAFDSTPPILRLALRCDGRAPALVRRALESAREVAPVLEDARLVASELVNNAVLHSGCAADDIIRVIARLDGALLTISVDDPGVSDQIPLLRPRAGEPGGLGLWIVEELAHRWGAEYVWGAELPRTHRVWAELAV